MFTCVDHKHLVRKARTKVKTTASYARLEKLSKRMGAATEVHLLKGVRTFKKRISTTALEQAYKSGNYTGLLKTVPWDDLHDDLEPYNKSLKSAARASAEFNIEALPAPIKTSLRFDVANPKISRWFAKNTGQFVSGIQYDTQRIIQTAVQRHFTQAQSPRQIANQIKDSIGLDPRRENALSNFRNNLESKGLFSTEKMDKMVSGYAERLLESRARTIARTETRAAVNHGQLSVWQAAADQGLIERKTVRKVWIVDGNPCEICEPMDGVTAPLDGFWTLNTGDVVEVPNDSHPNCFCGMELEYGDDADSDNE